MIVTRIERDLPRAVAFLNARGIHVPIIDMLPNIGWTVIDPNGVQRGGVVLFPSIDGEDFEMIADGGWTVPSARLIFDAVFNQLDQYRLTARCLSSNIKNIRVLQRMGFKIEGQKRCCDGNFVLFGMMREECRLLKRMK